MRDLSQSTAKLVRKLHQSKYRRQENKFLICGLKSVEEALANNYEISDVIYNPSKCDFSNFKGQKHLSKADKLASISPLQNLDDVIAIANILPAKQHEISNQITLLKIQNPGNLGTIIRVADWFNIKHIVCSSDTVDQYNPKVIQASMGSFTRVNLHYTQNVEQYINPEQHHSVSAHMEGIAVNQFKINKTSTFFNLFIGNESHGVPKEYREKYDCISIPKLGADCESLNAGMACGIILSHLCLG